MAIEVLLTRHGKEVSTKQMDLRRVADIAIDLYAMTAVLSRASRSYCIGLQNADHEVLDVNVTTNLSYLASYFVSLRFN